MPDVPEVLFVCVHNAAGLPAEQVRPIREDIDQRVRALLAELTATTHTATV